MLEDRRQRHGERLRQVRGPGFPLRQPRKDGAAGRVGQGGEGGVEGFYIVNHMVKCRTPPGGCQEAGGAALTPREALL